MTPKYGLVSIITPTYNCASFISETIRCVLNQIYTDWELIIVDDCSTDNTQKIVDEFRNQDNRIKYFCLGTNSGAAVARNKALTMANGRWVAFLDSDDLWPPEKLINQIQFMVDNRIHFSYTEYEEIDEDSQSLGILVSGPKHITRCGMYSYCWPGCLTVMYDRNYIGDIQIIPIKKNNDYAIWLKAIHSSDCYLLKSNLAKYRKRNGSISNSSYSDLIKWHYRLFRKTELFSAPVSILLTLNNLFWGVIKKLIYVKK